LGIPADFKEAVDWALLGWLTLSAQSGGAPPVTGAQRELVLGAVHAPTLLR
jgi:anhydro-N-acetylmuramic acid kinase